MADFQLVCRNVDAGKLEIGFALVIKDDVGVTLETARRLPCTERREHLKVARHILIDQEDADRVFAQRFRSDLISSLTDRPGTAVYEETTWRPIVEAGCSQNI